MHHSDLTAVADAVLVASRVLVAVAAQSLADLDDMTLPQYRSLVVLASRGPQNLSSLADILAVNPSTATRVTDRLVQRGLVRRDTSAQSRREIVLEVTPAGREVVQTVTRRRRAALARIVRRLSEAQRSQLVEALTAFGEAAGEVPEQAWSLGWST
ncbi:MAG: MarR family transcriptional regulator [Actinomycetota bacterium]|nr:MarR family transcriptional regulator [Actinomycetota bacterium]